MEFNRAKLPCGRAAVPKLIRCPGFAAGGDSCGVRNSIPTGVGYIGIIIAALMAFSYAGFTSPSVHFQRRCASIRDLIADWWANLQNRGDFTRTALEALLMLVLSVVSWRGIRRLRRWDGPLAFPAYPDGLRNVAAAHGLTAQEGLRAQLFDALLPRSVSFADYQRWRERVPILLGPPAALTGAVILVGAGPTDDTLQSLNEQTHNDWVAASLPQGAGPLAFDAALAQEFLNGAGADSHFVIFTLAGTLFAPTALQRMVARHATPGP